MAESIKPASTTIDESRRALRPNGASEEQSLPGEAGASARSVRQNTLRAFTPTAKDYMTPNPEAIASHESLASARRTMQEHAIRHLLVVDGQNVLGVISERDVGLVSALRGISPEELTVEQAASRDLYTAPVHTALSRVARGMVERKCGSAVITDHGEVVGILTTVDALEALADALEGKDQRSRYEMEIEGPARGSATRPPDRESRF